MNARSMSRKSKAKMKATQSELLVEKGKGPSSDSRVRNIKSLDSIMGVCYWRLRRKCR